MSRSTMLSFAASLLVAAGPSHAQWPRVASPKLPRTADGKVNLNAPPPRTADGHPDLSGVWEMYAEGQNPKLLTNLASRSETRRRGVPALGRNHLQTARREQRKGSSGRSVPALRLPEKDTVPHPYKIVQTPDEIVILYESRTIFRQIFTDGRSLPIDPNPAWQGYSVGHWDGDTLVVETAGFNGKTWLDMSGHPATDALHVIERFTRRDLGHMDLQITINDPKAYSKPWTVDAKVHLLPQDDLIEYVCEENNKAPGHMVGK